MFGRNKPKSEELSSMLGRGSGLLLQVVDYLEDIRNQAVVANVEAQKEIDELQEVQLESEDIRKKADKLLKLLD